MREPNQDVLDAVVTLADFLGVSIYSADEQGVIRVELDDLGRFLRSARNTSGLTQNQVASAVGMDTHASIHNYESGIVSPTVSRLQELAALYGYEIQVGFLKR